jgi:hypothetical protein
MMLTKIAVFRRGLEEAKKRLFASLTITEPAYFSPSTVSTRRNTVCFDVLYAAQIPTVNQKAKQTLTPIAGIQPVAIKGMRQITNEWPARMSVKLIFGIKQLRFRRDGPGRAGLRGRWNQDRFA